MPYPAQPHHHTHHHTTMTAPAQLPYFSQPIRLEFRTVKYAAQHTLSMRLANDALMRRTDNVWPR